MTLINRQRYMAELSKLLTFMYKEDRSEILQHYNELLDQAEDEQEMLESFGSPTKLAVTISRTYQRDERKLSVRADSKTGEAESAPRPAAAPLTAPEKVQPSQSYAEIIEEIRREKAAEQGLEYTPIFFDEQEKQEEMPEKAEAQPEEVPEEAEVSEDAAPAEEDPKDEPAPGEGSEAQPEEAPAGEEAESEAETESEEAEDADADEPEQSEEEAAAEAEDSENTEAETETEAEPETQSEPEEAEADAEAEEETPAEPVKVRKTNAFLLILYLIFAVPVGLLLYLLLIVLDLTLLCLGLGAAAIAVQTLSFAFSGMAVFADTILVFGAGLVAAAVALVLLWFAIWLSIKDIAALSRGLVALGRKICVREVEVNE